ncbi:MAG: 50S ribosomal protein L32 [Candidatus Eisenbacteria bacterium]|uniref:Large ribosomal subunit protein bL32 n=1 Tax=Eiseniibacteriota bacterium TaxID=2212470 RepID=A0A948RYJ1_UNCEI|nr:50S ribosomal protein L32 [Candidatus Eisenbacteria bacterium]MBU1948925.1 50S ribosomal protein L32 [Candidatus Eisenbacteria bacterium]MBU2690589.1 50S ribosomal protein L32 [Candidatus Eisenbacteria bacterium]
MALPKRRHSNTRQRKRRTHWKLARPSTSSCARCGQPKRSHRICPHCGYYRGQEMVVVST